MNVPDAGVLTTADALLPFGTPGSYRRRKGRRTTVRLEAKREGGEETQTTSFDVGIDLPPSGSNVRWQKKKVQPVLSVPSKLVEVRYKIPFGLDVVPKNNLAVCTKDGAGGEKVGDVLRFATQWTMGFSPADSGGIAGTLNSFAGGGLSWQCSVFDVVAATRWEQVVEALTSNTPDRTDEVVLVFERPIEEGVVAPEVQ